jgi:hypothetical protein
MPYLVSITTPPPTGDPSTPPEFPSAPRPVGTYPALTLTRGTSSLALTLALGWVILPGVDGLDDPPRSLIEVEPALWDGSLHMAARYRAREVFLPLHYATTSTEALRWMLRSLAALLDIKRGPVTLEVAHLDGTRRWIDGRLSAPFGTALEQAEGGLWRKVGLTLHCPDPFWLGEQRTKTYVTPDGEGLLSSQFLPLHLSESQIVGAETITNDGDAEAYPVWTLTGPVDSATIEVADTTFSVPDGLLDTETLVVDTRRGQQSVAVNGTTAWGRLSPGARLGALPSGESELTITLVGATSDTTLSLDWRERWLTAW